MTFTNESDRLYEELATLLLHINTEKSDFDRQLQQKEQEREKRETQLHTQIDQFEKKWMQEFQRLETVYGAELRKPASHDASNLPSISLPADDFDVSDIDRLFSQIKTNMDRVSNFAMKLRWRAQLQNAYRTLLTWYNGKRHILAQLLTDNSRDVFLLSAPGDNSEREYNGLCRSEQMQTLFTLQQDFWRESINGRYQGELPCLLARRFPLPMKCAEMMPGCNADPLEHPFFSETNGEGILNLPFIMPKVCCFVCDNKQEADSTKLWLMALMQQRLFKAINDNTTLYPWQAVLIDLTELSPNSIGWLKDLSGECETAYAAVPCLSRSDAEKTLNTLWEITHENNVSRTLIIRGYDNKLSEELLENFVLNHEEINTSVYLISEGGQIPSFLNRVQMGLFRAIDKNGRCKTIDNLPLLLAGSPSIQKMNRTFVEQVGELIHTQDKEKEHFSNDYEKLVGFFPYSYKQKGVRRIDSIPYGIDERGNLRYIGFENGSFASYLCGAAGSGKSTLLHTLITGMLKASHPDDLELWLIDFKMTEFSRYIKNLPPHVRYIVLDSSPELVYDVIDRLNEIMNKRKIRFMGKWEKLDDVPKTEYVPEIMVIIDEFSIMSQILTNDNLVCKNNYKLMLQNLLTNGRAMGMHFIFASQSYTSGSNGLTQMAKEQIQQRIVLKNEYGEIHDTLDLRDIGETDRKYMQDLPAHYTLTRGIPDRSGNRLYLSKVLYMADKQKQADLIQHMCETIRPERKYDCEDTAVYINKKPLIVDGNRYIPFEEKVTDMKALLQKEQTSLQTGDIFLFPGEPRRLCSVLPNRISSDRGDNVLLIAPKSESNPSASVIMSIITSLDMQNVDYEIWASHRDHVCATLSKTGFDRIITDYGEIKRRLSRLINDIRMRRDRKYVLIILGAEYVFEELEENTAASEDTSALPGTNSDLFSMEALDRMLGALEETESSSHFDDLLSLISDGPRYGCHTVLEFSSLMEFKYKKIKPEYFKHKYLFKMARKDAMDLVDVSNSYVVNDLDKHTFRYTNGLDNASYRPFLHRGLSWDNWSMDANETIDNEEEYLE